MIGARERAAHSAAHAAFVTAVTPRAEADLALAATP